LVIDAGYLLESLLMLEAIGIFVEESKGTASRQRLSEKGRPLFL
jgi:hypothetical protein